jgi:4-methylaminobutanoate oxidase (formaldehyde-forming)
LEKDHFIGKEALARIKAEGPKWQLCTFTIDADKPLMVQSSAPILYKGQVLGVTTSAGHGHTIGKTICYGYIPAGHIDYEDGFAVEIYREVYPAVCQPNRALYDPQREKILA